MRKTRTFIVIASLVIVLGLAITIYSDSHLRTSTVLYEKDSMQLGGYRYSGFGTAVNLAGKYDVNVTGYVGSVSCCVDFYLVNDSSEIAWNNATTPALRSAESVVHLNSTVIQQQSPAGEFSFVPKASTGYSVFFVNDNYPNASDTTVISNMVFHYSSLNWLYWMVGGLLVVVSGVSLLIFAIVDDRSLQLYDTLVPILYQVSERIVSCSIFL